MREIFLNLGFSSSSNTEFKMQKFCVDCAAECECAGTFQRPSSPSWRVAGSDQVDRFVVAGTAVSVSSPSPRGCRCSDHQLRFSRGFPSSVLPAGRELWFEAVPWRLLPGPRQKHCVALLSLAAASPGGNPCALFSSWPIRLRGRVEFLITGPRSPKHD